MQNIFYKHKVLSHDSIVVLWTLNMLYGQVLIGFVYVLSSSADDKDTDMSRHINFIRHQWYTYLLYRIFGHIQ